MQAYAALGCQFTRHIYAEVGYRYLYDDFRDESASDLLYQLALRGANYRWAKVLGAVRGCASGYAKWAHAFKRNPTLM